MPTLDLAPGGDFGSPAVGIGVLTDATGASAISAPACTGPAANPPDPSAEIAPAIALLETTSPPLPASDASSPSLPGSDTASTSLAPGPALGAGPLPQPGPVVGPPLPGPGVPSPWITVPSGPGGLTGPVLGNTTRPAPAPATSGQEASIAPIGSDLQAQAKVPEWLKKVLSPAVFLAWLLEPLPLLLRALLAGLAALLSALALPPGGVVWRLPPELTHQLGGVDQAHAALVRLADAALVRLADAALVRLADAALVRLADAALGLLLALIGLGHVAGPHAGLPVLPPRVVAPAPCGGGTGGPRQPGDRWLGDRPAQRPDGAVTPIGLVGFDARAWLQAGAGGLVLGVLYALAGLLLALGGWLRVALVDVLLVAAPVLAVLWVLPLTAHWGEWALRLFGNLLAGQWLQVLALWLGGQLLLAPAPDLATALGKSFAALAVLLAALWLPGLLPWPRGVGSLQVLFGFALARHAVQAVWGDRDRVRRDFERRKELEREYEAEHPRLRPAPRVQIVRNGRPRRPTGSPA